ncbi:galactose-binding domain-like protein, partial [Thamnocephalis sphaerospora]
RVSSVLNRDTSNYGKQHLTDGSEETCWNSDQGEPQYVAIDFGQSVRVRAVNIMFQGGFAGRRCQLMGVRTQPQSDETPGKYAALGAFYPEDINALQISLLISDAITRLKIVFEESTDHYGRITVYRLEVLGEEDA